MVERIEGYLLIPHELLHIIGCRLVGKRCLYRLGNRYVTPVGPMTRQENLVGLLFPFAVCILTWLGLLPVPFIALFVAGLEWAIGLSLIVCFPLAYAFTAIGDLRKAYLLIFDKPYGSPTPLDFFFWPIMKEHRESMHNASRIILICLILIGALYYFLVLF
jgi:hypothetical protein